jgi:ubiquitin-protein ligase
MDPFPKLAKNVAELSNILKYDTLTLGNLIDIMKITSSDLLLQKNLGKTEYGFIKFVLKTNNTNLISSQLFNKKEKNDIQENIFSSSNVTCYDVRHEPSLEEKFSCNELRYFFHGSSLANWYAILRNGLKNCSGTKLMVHGQAYGSGIYLSDSASMSFGYGNDKYTKTGTSVVGVIQVIGNTLQDNKNHIFVEPTEANLLLKYVLLIKSGANCDAITKYFTQDLTKASINALPLVAKVVSKRLVHDCKAMVSIIEKHGWNIDSVGDIWTINVGNLIKLCVKFNQNYPITPPFLWLKSTCYMSNKVTKYGAVMLNEIVPKNWIVSTKVYNLIEKFILELLSNNKTSLVNFDYDTAFNNYSSQLKTMQLV